MWAPAMVGAEVGLWLAAIGILIGAGFVAAGWVGGLAGTVGLALVVVAVVGFLVASMGTINAIDEAAEAARSFVGAKERLPRSVWLGLLQPFPRRPRGIRVTAAIRYGPHERHLLDHFDPGRPGPALVYVHGGGWQRGRRDTQARAMRYRLAAAGWHVFAPSYRLSPEATFPDHLVDVKRAIAWVRREASSLGVDSAFIAVAGGSSGGNLAALVALTGGDVRLQPGFEGDDTRVQACVPVYGVHDLLRRNGAPMWPYLVPSVMKVDPSLDPERWHAASPIRVVDGDAPPFFIVHGAADTLVPAALSRRLAEALRGHDGNQVSLLELSGANHGFDFFAGIRGRATAVVVERVLTHLHERRAVR